MDDCFDLPFKLRNYLSNYSPNSQKVDADIVMNQFVTHTRNLLPFHFRMSGPESFIQLLGSFSNNLKVPDNRILNKLVLHESAFIHTLGVCIYSGNTFTDVIKVNQHILLHTNRMRSVSI